MIEIITDIQIFAFDGRVLEIFEGEGTSQRFHIAHIVSIGFAPRKKSHRFELEYTRFKRPVIYDAGNDHVSEFQALTDAIREKMS